MKYWQAIETSNDKAARTFLEMLAQLDVRAYAIRERPGLLPDGVSYSDILKHGVYLPTPCITIYVKTDSKSFEYLDGQFLCIEYQTRSPVSSKFTSTIELSTQIQNTCCSFNRPMPDNLSKYM